MSISTSDIETSRYINPLTDYGFKKIFGEKETMIAFLTDLLEPASPITDIVFLDKEMRQDNAELRNVIYDLYCKTEDGGEFIVEMQNEYQKFFTDRIVYYLSKSLASQGGKGNQNWKFDIKPVYGIFFLNFHLDGLKPQAIRTMRVKVDETGEVVTDKVKAYTFELIDFKGKDVTYPKNKVEYWLYNLVNMETMTTTLPFQTQQPIFGKVGNDAALCNLSNDELRKYYKSLDTYRTAQAVLSYKYESGYEKGEKQGIEKGFKQGRAEGLAKGRAEGQQLMQMRIALSMRKMGITTAQIAQATGLSEQEINTLHD